MLPCQPKGSVQQGLHLPYLLAAHIGDDGTQGHVSGLDLPRHRDRPLQHLSVEGSLLVLEVLALEVIDLQEQSKGALDELGHPLHLGGRTATKRSQCGSHLLSFCFRRLLALLWPQTFSTKDVPADVAQGSLVSWGCPAAWGAGSKLCCSGGTSIPALQGRAVYVQQDKLSWSR